MKNTENLVSLHDEFFEKFKEFEISTKEATNVVGGKRVRVQFITESGHTFYWEGREGRIGSYVDKYNSANPDDAIVGGEIV